MSFKKDFMWGAATASYQVEGAAKEDGRGLSVWDVFCEKQGKIKDKSNGDIACDQYHRYEEDIELMAKMGLKAYRFSLSWSRILPEGTGKVNEKGIEYYSNLIDCLLAHGIEPFVTLYHWDLPYTLHKRGGWLNEESPEWFAEYAKIAAEYFSDRVKYFFTFNEPQCFVGLGYLSDIHAPGINGPDRDAFTAAHHVLKAHGRAVQVLREYGKQPLKIGFAPAGKYTYPKTAAPKDVEAAKKMMFDNIALEDWAWSVAWWSDPIFLGKYPEAVCEKYKDILPAFTQEDMDLIHQPIDFVGQNIYDGRMVACGDDGEPYFVPDYIGAPYTTINSPVTPEILYWMPKFLYERYGKPVIITESGMANVDIVSADGQVHDGSRIAYLESYLQNLCKAADEVPIDGYFLWSLLDNFEWAHGYQGRFGLIYVDFRTQKRIPKDSAKWYQTVIATNGGCLHR
ncbi:MAG TPA: beta-glucosidase [Candidatus Scybalocola faecipullorum]|nr:beta-glucosidase [Candidatus Scybalocola faecipullorum]